METVGGGLAVWLLWRLVEVILDIGRCAAWSTWTLSLVVVETGRGGHEVWSLRRLVEVNLKFGCCGNWSR